MCQRFMDDFVEKVIDKLDYNDCKGGNYKFFDHNMVRFVSPIMYKPEIDDKFYYDLCIYFFHNQNIEDLVNMLRILHIHTGDRIVRMIAKEIKKHINCIDYKQNYIVFGYYDNISWNELSYVYARERSLYYGEKMTKSFHEWIHIFIESFC